MKKYGCNYWKKAYGKHSGIVQKQVTMDDLFI